jgi:hypothetical protein
MAEQTIPVPVQKSFFDLDSFEDVTLVKEGSFEPVADTASALARVGNDASKFLALVNEGLKAEYQRQFRADPSGWMLKDEDGNLTPFTGTPADSVAVGALVLNLAKTVYRYSKEMSASDKAKAKESAMTLIKNTADIREVLKKNGAALA